VYGKALFILRISRYPIACAQGESATGDQNRKIAEVLYRSGCVETELDRDEGLEAYFMGCSTNVDVKELAVSATPRPCSYIFLTYH
jgi:glutaminase